MAGRGDQVPAQLPWRQSPVPRLGAQLQDLLGKALPIDRRFAEKAFHPLTVGQALCLQTFQGRAPEQLTALLLEQRRALLVLIQGGTGQCADDGEQAQATQERDSPLDRETSEEHAEVSCA
ncbi:hypothetical protein D3C80_1787180 [compost metagenome]